MLIASALKLVTLTNIIKLQHPQHNNCFIWCLVSGLKFSLSFLSTNITEVYFPGLDINFAPWWQFREASEGCSGALQDTCPISPRQWQWHHIKYEFISILLSCHKFEMSIIVCELGKTLLKSFAQHFTFWVKEVTTLIV